MSLLPEQLTAQNGTVYLPQAKKMSLAGWVSHRLDKQRRLTIPTIYFELMGKPEFVYAMPGKSNKGLSCVTVMSLDEFSRKMDLFKEAALSDSEAADFVEELVANVTILPLDAQHRIRVKDSLLTYAQISADTEEVAIVGRNSYFEIWSVENYPCPDGTESDFVDKHASKARRFNLI